MLYAIAGNGTGPAKEITGALKDLKDAATKDPDAEFWIIIEGKDEPTTTDNAIIKWMVAQEVWFEVYTSTGTTIDAAQETYGTDDVFGSMMERMQERLQEDEPATLLVLLTEDEDADEAVGVLVEQSIDGEVPVYQLNGEMAPITLEDGEGAEPEEPEEAPPPPAKAAAKKAAGASKKAAAAAPAKATKAASKKAAATPVAAAEDEVPDDDGAPNDDDAPEEPSDIVVYTPEELAKMTVAELGAVARSQGIDPKGMGKRDLIDSIKSKMAPEVTLPIASTNGDVLVVIHLPGSIVTKLVPVADALALASQ